MHLAVRSGHLRNQLCLGCVEVNFLVVFVLLCHLIDQCIHFSNRQVPVSQRDMKCNLNVLVCLTSSITHAVYYGRGPTENRSKFFIFFACESKKRVQQCIV